MACNVQCMRCLTVYHSDHPICPWCCSQYSTRPTEQSTSPSPTFQKPVRWSMMKRRVKKLKGKP